MLFQPFHLFFLLDHGNVNKVFQFNFDVCFSVCLFFNWVQCTFFVKVTFVCTHFQINSSMGSFSSHLVTFSPSVLSELMRHLESSVAFFLSVIYHIVSFSSHERVMLLCSLSLLFRFFSVFLSHHLFVCECECLHIKSCIPYIPPPTLFSFLFLFF